MSESMDKIAKKKYWRHRWTYGHYFWEYQHFQPCRQVSASAGDILGVVNDMFVGDTFIGNTSESVGNATRRAGNTSEGGLRRQPSPGVVHTVRSQLEVVTDWERTGRPASDDPVFWHTRSSGSHKNDIIFPGLPKQWGHRSTEKSENASVYSTWKLVNLIYKARYARARTPTKS